MAARLGSLDCFLQQCQTPFQKNNTLLLNNQTEFLCHFIPFFPFFQFCPCSQLASVCWVLAVVAQGDKKAGIRQKYYEEIPQFRAVSYKQLAVDVN